MWHFSRPSDRRSADAPVQLDRRTTYNAGPVANRTGPIALGNFNRTMRGYGYDRQFRGEIARLQVYGSRISSRGALDQPALEALK